jgi:alpha-beta hydrolase superfamily lysophospholipase
VASIAHCLAASAAAAVFGLSAVVPLPARASDDASLPRSLAQAISLERGAALARPAFYDPPSLAGSAPGALLREAAFDGYMLPSGARAIRILYHSLSAAGRDVATSAVVLIPAGRPPAGGWPVIAWAHGTTGVARQCAPSLQKDLVYGDEGLMPMVRAGFAVVATDYHGLGTPGPHEYVNKIAQARDVIYSIPAARKAVPSLSRQWAAVGHSQGGVAMWGVAELESTLRDPDYLGAVSVAGAGDLRVGLGRMASSGDAAAFYLAYMAYAIHARTPEFHASDMLVGNALARYPAATTKGCWYYAYASFLGDHGGPVLKAGWERTAGAERFFAENVMGEQPMRRPFLVLAGEGDRTVAIEGVRGTVEQACAAGNPVAFRSYPKLDHDETMQQATPDILDWIRDRIAGRPVTGECASVPR